MNVSEEDRAVRAVMSIDDKEEQLNIQSESEIRNEEKEESKEPILTGRMLADRAYYVLHRCLGSPDMNEPSRQPTESDWHEQRFRYWDTLRNAPKILVRDGHIEEQTGKFLMPKKWGS